MKKLVSLSIIFLLMSSFAVLEVEPIRLASSGLKLAPPLTDLTIDNINFENDYAGEENTLWFRIINGNSVSENVNIIIDYTASFTEKDTVFISYLAPQQTVFVVEHVVHPQPGFFIGNIDITYDTGSLNEHFDQDIEGNPTQSAPVVYDIPDVVFYEGEQEELNLNDYVTDINGDDIDWSNSGNTNIIVSITNGVATISGASGWTGTEVITYTAEDNNGGTDSDFSVTTILPQPTLTITPNEATIYVTETVQLSASGGTAPYTWTVISGSSFCSIDANGLVTGTGAGDCVVEAEDSIGQTGTALIHVMEIPNVTVTPPTATLYIGGNQQFSASGGVGPYTWSISTGSSFCSIDQTGLVTAIAVGSCTVLVEDDNSPGEGTATVTVDPLPVITITPVDPEVYVTDSIQLIASGGNGPYNWQVIAGSGFCSVNSNGLLTGLAVGTSTVEAEDIPSGATANVDVDILEIPTVAVTPSASTIYETETVQLSASGGVGPYTWSILSGATHCSVDQTGLVTALAVGTCTVLADDDNSPGEGTATVTVNAIPTVVVSPSTADILVGDDQQFSVSGGVGPYTWSISSGSSFCSVDQTGLVTALAVGTCTVLADDDNSPGFDTSTVNVLAGNTIEGNVYNIFTDDEIVGALVTIYDAGVVRTDTTDSNGDYSITVSGTGYLRVTLTHTDFTPRHTWVDVPVTVMDFMKTKHALKEIKAPLDLITQDYNMIPDDFYWLLYNEAFRGNTDGWITDYGPGNMQWENPPIINVFSDTSFVGGQDLTNNVNTMLDNLENILPTFNPRDAIFSNVAVEPTFFTLPNYEVAVYWDNGITGAGNALIVSDNGGPGILKASAIFKSTINPTEPDNWVYNQELGTLFGATQEPTSVQPDETVFADPTLENTYTPYDYECAEIYLDRSRIHYWNQSASGLDAYDWEIRPDLVSNYYGTKKKSPQKVIHYIFNEDGSRDTFTYKYDEVPEDVKLTFPEMFEGYMEKRLALEKK